MELERRRQSDRDWEEMFTLVKQTRDQVAEMNGSVRRHNEEIFGGNNQPGLRHEVDDCHDFMVSTKSGVKAIVTLLSLIGVVNIIALIVFMANLGG